MKSTPVPVAMLQALPEFIEQHARLRPDAPALIEGTQSLDWRQYALAARALAQTLLMHDVQPGDRVAFLGSNRAWGYVALAGVLRARAVFTPLSPLLTPALIATLLRDSGARVLLVTRDMDDVARVALDEGGLRDTVRVVAEPGGSATDVPISGSGQEPAFPQPAAHCTLIYSSGTTGTPKGILHTHLTRVLMGLAVAASAGVSDRSRVATFTPLHSNGTFIFVLPALVCGGCIIVGGAYTPERLIEAVEIQRATHVFLVPTLLRSLAAHGRFGSFDASSLVTLLSAGAPLQDALRDQLLARFGASLRQLWGLTEGLATLAHASDMALHAQSVGRPLPTVDLRIVDSAGAEITQGAGEIVGRSAFLMEGYLHAAAGDAPSWTDRHGRTYLRTGDLGSVDASGNLLLKGRLKDLIISGGLNVYPSDIEPVLLAHAAVEDAVVTGVAHDKWGEVPVAYVRLRGAAAPCAAELRDWVNARVAKPQRLHEVRIMTEDFPRNALGKVLKHLLR